MKMSGSIRWTERETCRFVASRQSPPLLTFQEGTARPGPDAHHSGPGLFFADGPPKAFCTVPKSVVPRSRATSYLIPLERKSRLGTARSNFYE
jgi:hypothetical protein